jgi:hypothetical protein
VLPATLTAQLDSNRAFMMGFATATKNNKIRAAA